MGMSGQPVISARARGSDLTMIAGTVNKMNYVLVTAPSVKKPEDLKGKRIGRAPGRDRLLPRSLARIKALGP